MAISLPYPNMTFAPLDVLTAEELNQIVSNIGTLANVFPLTSSNISSGAVGSNQIASSAVSADKINWSGFPCTYTECSETNITSPNIWNDVLTASLASFPTGARIAVFGELQFSGSGTIATAAARLRYNGTHSKEYNVTTTWGRSVGVSWQTTKSASANTIYLSAKKDNETSMNVQWGHLLAFRVA